MPQRTRKTCDTLISEFSKNLQFPADLPFLIKNSESAGNLRFFENFEMNVSQVFIVLRGIRKTLMQLTALWD